MKVVYHICTHTQTHTTHNTHTHFKMFWTYIIWKE